jgi:hypothetical protein
MDTLAQVKDAGAESSIVVVVVCANFISSPLWASHRSWPQKLRAVVLFLGKLVLLVCLTLSQNVRHMSRGSKTKLLDIGKTNVRQV